MLALKSGFTKGKSSKTWKLKNVTTKKSKIPQDV